MRKLLLAMIFLIPAVLSGRSSTDQALIEATKLGDVDSVKSLIEKGADVNTENDWGCTPLHYAADSGYVDIAKLLIEHGADVNAKDSDGWTPLHYALKNGHTDVAELLKKHGARRGQH